MRNENPCRFWCTMAEKYWLIHWFDWERWRYKQRRWEKISTEQSNDVKFRTNGKPRPFRQHKKWEADRWFFYRCIHLTCKRQSSLTHTHTHTVKCAAYSLQPFFILTGFLTCNKTPHELSVRKTLYALIERPWPSCAARGSVIRMRSFTFPNGGFRHRFNGHGHQYCNQTQHSHLERGRRTPRRDVQRE